MRKTLLILSLFIYSISNTQNVNIPDSNFKQALLDANTTNYIAQDNNGNNMLIDVNGDNEIQVSEAQAVFKLHISSKEISNLTGIEEFINLTQLSCDYNQLTVINVSNNTDLLELFCGDNQLSTLEVSNNINLTKLYCNDNQLTSLEVNNNTNLKFIECGYNQLTALDVSNITSLTNLSCGDNQLSTLDLRNNINLSWLYCSNNQLTTLDTSTNTSLLFCSSNQLTAIDVSNNVNLSWFYCDDNQLTAIDVSNNTSLSKLYCDNNPVLAYINLKNGNNDSLVIEGDNPSNFENLLNLQNVCVDELNTDLTTYITTQTGHAVNYTTDCSILNTIENKLLDFAIYPTPTKNSLHINSKTSIKNVEIYNKLGQLVLKTTKQTIDITILSQGIYFVKITDIYGNYGMKKMIKK